MSDQEQGLKQELTARQMAMVAVGGSGLRSPLGAAGSIVGFIAIVAAVACTWWVKQSSIAAKSAGIYLLVLSAAYWIVRRRSGGDDAMKG